MDFGVSEWPYSSVDYEYYPDLQMFPAFAGAVVPVYNIPELASVKSPVVFSRATLAAVFLGKIRHWNDSRILNDNLNSNVYSVLRTVQQPITVVVRQDSSGISMILAQALNSFDPATDGGPSDYSFANTVGRTSVLAKPNWCDPLTDEVFYFKVSQCSVVWSASQKLVGMRVVDPSLTVRALNWPCDATAADLQNAFMEQLGMSVTVNLQKAAGDLLSWTYQVGFSDTRVVAQNWFKPVLKSSTARVTVSTLQEGGFWNAHYKVSNYYVTPAIQSLFVLNNSYAAVLFNLTYVGASGAAATTAQLDSSVSDLCAALQTALKMVVPLGVTVTKVAHTASSSPRWAQYQITFAEQRNVPVLGVNAHYKSNSLLAGGTVSAGTSTTAATLVTSLLDYSNYPRFPDPSYSGVASGGRFTCYKRGLNYAPFSFLTAQLTDLNAQVRTPLDPVTHLTY